MRGQPRHLSAYRHEQDVLKGLDGALKRARAADTEPAERAAIDETERELVNLRSVEDRALEEISAGRGDLARERLFGPEHERAQGAVLAPLERFRALVAFRTEAQVDRAQLFSDRAILMAKITLGITALLFVGVLYFVIRRRITLPLVRMAGVVTRLARQDYDVEVTDGRRRDEIGDMAQAIQVFRDNGVERDRLEAEQRSDQQIKDAILQMMHRLQACETREELADVVACFAPQTFPELAGALHVLDEQRNALASVATWLEPERCARAIADMGTPATKPPAGVRLGALKPDEAVTCLMLDIDHFKRFNDTFGYDAGDAVMQHVARIMEEVLGNTGTAYRFGGEEFTILLPGADEPGALAQGEALRLRVSDAQLAHHGRMLGHVTMSLGLAAAPANGPPGTLLRQADVALLQAKAKGRNQVVTASQLVVPVASPHGVRAG